MEYVACNLCGSDDAKHCCTVGDSRIVRCLVCGLLYINPRRSAREIADLYSENYFASKDPSTLGYDDYTTHEKGLKQVFADRLSIIERYILPPASIIDIGCAFGYFIQVAASHGWIAEGVEISASASRIARENTKAQVHTGTLSTLNLRDAGYDAATAWDALEHFVDPARELAEINRILKPNGYLFMTVPNAGSLSARLMGKHWYGFKSAAEHNYFFTQNTLAGLLSKTGFKMLETRRGVWPCSLQFLTSKFAPYSIKVSRLAEKAVKLLKAENVVMRFRFIDMLVVAQKCREIR